MPPKPDAAAVLNDPRPKIRLPGDNRLLSDFATELGQLLAGANIFNRGGMVVRPDPTMTKVEPMGPEELRTWVERHLVCFKLKQAGAHEVIQVRHTMTTSNAQGVLASPQFISQLPWLDRVNPVRMPAMIDGRVELLPEGYDARARTFTASGAVPICEQMTLKDAQEIITNLLQEFPFADDGRSRAVTVAGMLSVFAGGLLPKGALRPCFIFLANAEGAGKSLLMKVCTVPTLGYAPTGSMPKDEDEMRKRIATTVMEARPVLTLDNVKGHLSSESLEGFLTSQTWTDRILGQSKSFSGDNLTSVFVTGNGCTVSPDLRRRSLFVELFSKELRPEDRQFGQVLEVPRLLEIRPEILSALWAFVREWDQAGRPRPRKINSSFPEWSAVIGGITQFANFGCPLDTPQIEGAADTNAEDMAKLVEALADGAVRRSLEFLSLVKVSQDLGLFDWCLPPDAVLEGEPKEMDKDARKIKKTFSSLLKKYDRRIIGAYRFLVVGKGHQRLYEIKKEAPLEA